MFRVTVEILSLKDHGGGRAVRVRANSTLMSQISEHVPRNEIVYIPQKQRLCRVYGIC